MSFLKKNREGTFCQGSYLPLVFFILNGVLTGFSVKLVAALTEYTSNIKYFGSSECF